MAEAASDLMAVQSIELNDFAESQRNSVIHLDIGETAASRSENDRREEAVELHPVDQGFHAWLFVFSAFILECLVWGFPFR
jgi:hypothetical protein